LTSENTQSSSKYIALPNFKMNSEEEEKETVPLEEKPSSRKVYFADEELAFTKNSNKRPRLQ
jgi:hypothetical protein